MVGMKSIIVCAIWAATAIAIPLLPSADQADDATCGHSHYTDPQILDAAAAGCKLVQSHTTAGNGKRHYPHQFDNRENFPFLDGVRPFYEFPMLETGVYTGGSPGADRVIFDSKCAVVGEVTHEGAKKRNGFDQCQKN